MSVIYADKKVGRPTGAEGEALGNFLAWGNFYRDRLAGSETSLVDRLMGPLLDPRKEEPVLILAQASLAVTLATDRNIVPIPYGAPLTPGSPDY